MSSWGAKIAATAALSVGCVMAAQAAPVLPNNPGGDSFTNAGASNTGQAVGASGWYYNNVRNGGTVGINGTYPQSGNASVYFSAPQSGATSSKADIEYLGSSVIADANGNYFSTGSLGLFRELQSMSYQWYRDSSSATANGGAGLAPSLRVMIDVDGNLATGDRGYLIYEPIYNGIGKVMPTDSWQTANIAGSSVVWNSNFFVAGLGMLSDIDGDGNAYDTLAEWQASSRMVDAVIVGFSSGVGSGWQPFTGAVDNISWTIAGVTTTSNFEVVAAADIPEPGSLALAAGALLSLGALRRRGRRA